MFLNSFSYLEKGAATFGNEYSHPELVRMRLKYRRLRDCLTSNVKDQGTAYLPDPSEVREDPDIKRERWVKYHQRATFLPVTRRTQQGLVGQVFVRKPVITKGNLPDAVISSVSIQGHSLESFANYILSETVATGRGVVVAGISDVQGSNASLDYVEAENVLTWAELPYGRTDALGRNIGNVVLRMFTSQLSSDGITPEMVARLAQYRLDDNGYAFLRLCTSTVDHTNWSGYVPIVAFGVHLRYLPVFPIGADDNTLRISNPPLLELADLNISHYVNSADYEEHVNVAGQLTTVVSGLEQKWYDKNINGKIAFGVRSPLPLPQAAKAYLLQAQANSTAKEAMDKKEAMMVSVGARLIEQRQVRRTATESNIEAESYHSILGHIAINVATGISDALTALGAYYKGDAAQNGIALNTEFGIVATSAEHRRLLLEEWQKGIRSYSETRRALRHYDDRLDDDNVAKKEIEEGLELLKKVASVGNKPVTGADNRT